MEAAELAKAHDYDVIVMDIMMPKLDGYSAVKEIRKTKKTPVIMLSARGEEYDKLFGFEIGVDDYVVKPFSPKELMARIKAVIARSKPSRISEEEVLIYKGLEINFTAREVKIDGERVAMTPKEYDLLFYRTVDTHIKMLRNSLGEYRNLIVTLRGMGYKFEKIEQ